jgi:hypothetical protein
MHALSGVSFVALETYNVISSPAGNIPTTPHFNRFTTGHALSTRYFHDHLSADVSTQRFEFAKHGAGAGVDSACLHLAAGTGGSRKNSKRRKCLPQVLHTAKRQCPASNAHDVSQPKREQDHAWNLQRRLDTDYQAGDAARKINASIANILAAISGEGMLMPRQRSRLVTSLHAIRSALILVSLDSC